MPLLPSPYKPPFYLRSGFWQTTSPTLFRKLEFIQPNRERIDTPDDDFLDLDWYKQGARSLVIITHGLEGSASRKYVVGMARIFHEAGYDALAWNMRSCSGEINRQLRFYHSGASDDLEVVVKHAISSGKYDSLFLIGFSLGGNVTLRYFGEQSDHIPGQVKGGMGVSVPLDLTASAIELDRFRNKLFMARFLHYLGKKVRAKEKLYPDKISSKGYEKITTFHAFDNTYTAPIHGYGTAKNYYFQASGIRVLANTKRPLLILNAEDDSFLSPECFPEAIARDHEFVYLEKAKYGGHCGFMSGKEYPYYSEQRALEFARDFAGFKP